MKLQRKRILQFRALTLTLLAVLAALAFTATRISAGNEKTLPVSSVQKLDTQLVLALKKSRGEPPFDKPTSLEPNIPVKHNGRVLVDIRASVSKGLLNQIVLVGGWVDNKSTTATTVRAMVPFSQLEALAARPDVKFILPAILIVNSKVKEPR